MLGTPSLSEALTLGLASGMGCLGSCAAVCLPWLVAEHQTLLKTMLRWVILLFGRFCGYLIYAVFAWLLGTVLAMSTRVELIFALAEIAMGVWLAYYGFRPVRSGACGGCGPKRALPLGITYSMTPFLLGFFAGVTPCPPFLLATVRAAEQKDLFGSVMFFTMFYLGTLAWFVPFPVIGALGRYHKVGQVAKFAAGLVGLIYAYLGVLKFGGLWIHG